MKGEGSEADTSVTQVTDEHSAALRSYLADPPEVWMPMHRRLLDSGEVDAYQALFYAAFTVAARRKFSPTWSVAKVIQFVARVRAALGKDARLIDPGVAETLVRRALNDESLQGGEFADIDQETKARTQLVLLTAMVDDLDLDQSGLASFLKQSRELANQ